jgi:hypothetical protein
MPAHRTEAGELQELQQVRGGGQWVDVDRRRILPRLPCCRTPDANAASWLGSATRNPVYGPLTWDGHAEVSD